MLNENLVKTYKVNFKNFQEVYTNSEKFIDPIKYFQFYKTLDNIVEDFKEKGIIEKIQLYFKLKDLDYNYAIFTGQSIIDMLYQNQLLNLKPLDSNFNDIDIFIPTSLNYHFASRGTIFTSVDVDAYNELFSADYGYRILETSKTTIKLDNMKTINFILYRDFYSEIEFLKMNQKEKFIYSTLSTLNYFDINSVQIGFLIDLDKKEFYLLYTKDFYEFLINKQFLINKKRVSKKTLMRLANKYNKILGWVDLAKRNKKINIENNFLTGKYYLDRNYLDALMFLHDKMKQYLFYNAYYLIDKNELKNDDSLKFLQTLATFYYNVSQFENFSGDFLENESKQFFFIFNSFISKYSFTYEFKKRIINTKIEKKLNISDFSKKFYEIIIPDFNLTFHKSFGKIDAEKIRVSIDSKRKKILNYLITIFYSNDALNYNFKNLIQILHLISILSTLSLKKLKRLQEYCKRNYLDFKEMLIYIQQEPKILNLNLNKFKFLKEFTMGHDFYLFKIPFKFSLNPQYTLEIFEYAMQRFKEKIKEFNKKYDLDFTIMEFIGHFERDVLKFWRAVFENRVDEFIDEYFKLFEIKYIENLKQRQKPFHQFKKIKFSIDGITCEELINENELIKEGKFMHHCVGGYGEACRSFDSIIFRLYPENRSPFEKYREEDFRYTFELSPSTTKDLNFELIQIRGKSNKSPEIEHQLLAEKLIDETKKRLTERFKKSIFELKEIKETKNFI